MNVIMRAARVLARLAGALLLVVLALPFGWRLVTGDTFMEVTGRSMEPTYAIGDVLAVQEPTGDDLVVGQIVVATFGAGESATRYVHRVHEVTSDGAVLKGDNNDVVDPRPIQQADVLGTPRLHLTGVIAEMYRLSQGLVARVVLVAAAVVLLFGVPQLTRIGAGRGRHRRSAAHPAPASSTRPPRVERTPTTAR